MVMMTSRLQIPLLMTPRRGLALVVLGLVPFVAGCPTEVPYEEVPATSEADPDSEAPSFDSDAEETASDQKTPIEPEKQAPPDRYADTTTELPEGLPWETDEADKSTSAEADRFFGGATSETPSPPDPASEAADSQDDPAAEDDDSFGDFLGDSYRELADKKRADQVASSGMPSAPEVSEETPPQEEPDASETPPVDPPDFWASNDKPAEESPPAAESTPTQTPAKEPTTTEPAAAETLADLWDDEPLPETDEATPRADRPSTDLPLPETTAPEPTSSPEIAENESPPTELSADAWVGPIPDADDDSVDNPSAELPLPPTEPETEDESDEVTPRIASNTATSERAALMASSGVESLPAVPVLPYNTRHLAWLLGGKLGLAELADLDGATPKEITAWTDEVARLANELKISDPTIKSTESAVDKRVARLMQAAAKTGDELAKEHGLDHAALMEISLKTNALLVIAADHPEMAKPVAKAIRAAAGRAVLPRFLWEETVQVLQRNPTPEQTLATVTDLHQRVESFLR